MFIRKFLGLVIILFMVNLLGCATSPKKTDEKSLIESERFPVTKDRIDYLKESEQEATRFSTLKEAIKERFPLKKIQTAEKVAVAKEKSRPRHIIPAKDIQTALKNAGYYTGNIDGKIGPKTDSAIKAFQKDNSLKVDGVVGQKTWNLLSKYLVLQKGGIVSGKEEVHIMQTLVPAEGTAPSPIAQIPAVSTPSKEETPAVEKEPSIVEAPVVEIPVAERNFTPLKVIVIIVLAIILAVSIYRRRHV